MTRTVGYPRPQLERVGWICLNGPWDFALDPGARWSLPDQVPWDGTQIIVPFSPETQASGVGEPGFYRACWYRRTFSAPRIADGKRLLLHFGAVDYQATVWVNGRLAVRHLGGYTPFHADITDLLHESGSQVIEVLAEDDPADLAKPRGKQDWQLHPHSIWYPRTTGIWQTVWLEVVPAVWIEQVRWTPNVERWELALDVVIQGELRNDMRLNVRLEANDTLLADDVYTVVAGEVHRKIVFSDPGIDDYRNELLWSPIRPTLIQAQLELLTPEGEAADVVLSYTAMRSIGIQGNRLVLNGRPISLRLVLDQGYWPETGITAPSDDALRKDVELAKSMGFNGVRKHQKIEDPRYLYWADRLGLLVWEEMPSAYRFTRRSIERLMVEWTEAIKRDSSHPCIIAWVPLNESWGVPDLPDSPTQRHYVQALYHLTKTLDPTRPVVGNDGWESVATDIIGIHDYDENPETIRERYGSEDQTLSRLAERERPGGRLLVLDTNLQGLLPIILTEFGGIACSPDRERTWGYSLAKDSEQFAEQYSRLLEAVRSIPMLAGFCYTQFADTYQEANGLLYADRTPKFPMRRMRLATAGPKGEREQQVETKWRDRLMQVQLFQYSIPSEDHRSQQDRG
jgi:beta-galactosidase/beta-glucuronidase